jgi:sialic acid synthase SpsE
MMHTKFVAEVSSNHNKDLGRCLEFVEKAAEIGCDAVKFQLFKISKLFAPEILAKSQEHRNRRQWELPKEFIPILADKTHKLGLEFSCTPFYLEAVDFLKPYVDFYKISSYELLWSALLEKCAKTGLPVVLSTGMADLDEINVAYNMLKQYGAQDITLLHCVSSYPVKPQECNLSVIETLRIKYKCKVGWSDHSVDPCVIYRAVHRWSAEMIEFHLDLDKTGKEHKTGHCWLPSQIQDIIKTIKERIAADGNGIKVPAQSEIEERQWRADPEDGLRPFKKIRKSF